MDFGTKTLALGFIIAVCLGMVVILTIEWAAKSELAQPSRHICNEEK